MSSEKIKKHLNKISSLVMLVAFVLGMARLFTLPPAYAAFTVGVPKVNPPTLASGLIGWWTMDGKNMTSTRALDMSGNGNNATTTATKASTGKIGQALGFSTAVMPPSGLVGWWNMDSNQISGSSLTDLSGNGNTGTITEAVSVGGKLGEALSFDGSNDAVNLGASSILAPSSAITVCAWANPSVSNVYKILVSRWNSTTNVGQIFDLNIQSSGKFGLSINATNGADENLTGNTSITNGTWYHVCGTADNNGGANNQKIYVNGALDAERTTSASILATDLSNSVRLGRDETGNGFFSGSLDDVRIYNRALSAAEIGYLAATPPNLTISPTSSLNTLSAVSLGTWVKYASSTATQTLIRKSDTPTGTNSYELKSNGTNFQFTIGTSTSMTTLTGTTSIAPNKWYYVSGTYDGATNIQKLYVNGTLESSTAGGGTAGTITTGTTNWANSLFIGSDDKPGNSFVGVIDDARLYNRALSATEVTKLYNMGGVKLTTNVPKPTPTGLASGLVGWWTMDGRDCGLTYCVDKSVSRNTGTHTGTVPVVGKIGQARKYNGVNEWTSVLDSNSLDLTNAFTLSLWMKSNTLAPGNTYLISKLTDAGNDNAYSIVYGYTSQTVEFYAAGNSYGRPATNSEIPVTDKKWHHIVYTYNGTTFIGYKDGVAITPVTATSNLTASTGNLFIGEFGDTTHPYDGTLDDVRIYNRALSATEVTQLYRLGK